MLLIRTRRCRQCQRSAEITPAQAIMRIEGDGLDNIVSATYVYYCPYPDCGSLEEHDLEKGLVLPLRAMGVHVVRRDALDLPEHRLSEAEVKEMERRIAASSAEAIFADLNCIEDDDDDDDDEIDD